MPDDKSCGEDRRIYRRARLDNHSPSVRLFQGQASPLCLKKALYIGGKWNPRPPSQVSLFRWLNEA